ncbi:MAG: hypothetical protein AVDCRST_MAG56-2143 [uncultured Cytophagales bacterium]|uniref:Uncharacterized protein n=1 Tax=uncultured Cytophagales bacterium TaxID=158755 RepID=A0A6J4IKW0_9SPHI|nr:MAG: hypothetical protein AVDCRST_MAG56-2143 [uncultured Cytophagales bacterium]
MSQSAGQALKQLNAQDVSRTLERTMNVFQGNHEQFPELLKDAGSFLINHFRKLDRRQQYVALGVIAVGAVLLGVRLINQLEEGEVEEVTP